MTGKTVNEGTSEEVASIVHKPLGKPHIQPKVTPAAAPQSTQHPVSFYSRNMVTARLRTDINKKWEACWPINEVRPLVLLDLISYLLFIKKIEEKQLLRGKPTETFLDNLIHTKERDELSWSRFKDLDPQSMHNQFIKEKGIPDLLKTYSRTNLRYSLFLKEPLLLTPTANLLSHIVDIIKIMEAEDSNTQGAIFQYLLHKTEITAQNGQVYAPDYVIKLMVALMQPTPEDVIGDPSAGNGSLLVNSALYIINRQSSVIPDFKSNFAGDIYKGIESDLVQLRIGAMNMILHGIEDPKLEVLNVFSKANLSVRQQPTLILSNLFFEGTENKTSATADTLQTDNRRQEILFLNLILKSLKRGGRAAVIIKEVILYDNITEIKAIRQKIIDDHKLEAVISLPNKTGSLFSGACILIFSNPGTINTTDKVWFYKMETGKEGIPASNEDAFSTAEEYNEVPDILSRWKNEKEETSRGRTGKSFFVTVDEIITNSYNLSFNEYRKIVKEAQQYPPRQTPITVKKTVLINTAQAPPRGTTMLVKLRAQVPYVFKRFQPLKEGMATLRVWASRVMKRLKLFKGIPFLEKLRGQAPGIIKKPSTLLVILLVIAVVTVASYFIFSKRKNDLPVSTAAPDNISTGKTKQGQPIQKQDTKTSKSGMLSEEHIKAMIKDTTTGITYFQKPASNSPQDANGTPGVSPKNTNTASLPVKKPAAIPEPVTSANTSRVRYSVVDTTYFHDEPDKRTRRKSYLDPLNKNVLTPISEQNGFIFIVYTNRFGRTSKGWINKKDLRPLK